VGFLKDDRRTNVAITRAKRHLTIVADSETISTHQFLQRLVSYLHINAEYYSGENYIDSSVPRAYHVTDVTEIKTNDLPKKITQKQKKEKQKEKQNIIPLTKPKQYINPLNVASLTPVTNTSDQAQKIESQLQDFLKDDAKNEILFPSSLSSYERMLVHEISTKLGLNHISTGDNDNRHVVVSKSEIINLV